LSDHLAERSRAIDTVMDRFFIPITLAPALVLLFTIVVYPACYLLVVSVLNLEPMTMVNPRFVGLKNYLDAFRSAEFWDSLRVSGIYVFSTAVLSFTVGMILATTLNELKRLRTLFVTVVLLPWVIPPAISGLMWKWIFHDSWGLANDILGRIGLVRDPINWLGNERRAMLALIITDSWTRIPFSMIMFLASLQAIPHELYESAWLDGASDLQCFWRITFQLLRPAIFMVVLILMVFSFRTYSIINTLTGGGPGDATRTLALYVFENGIEYLKMSYGSALSVIMIVLILIFSYINNRVVRPEQIEE
jgi:multiple sugar transport system permease protein